MHWKSSLSNGFFGICIFKKTAVLTKERILINAVYLKIFQASLSFGKIWRKNIPFRPFLGKTYFSCTKSGYWVLIWVFTHLIFFTDTQYLQPPRNWRVQIGLDISNVWLVRSSDYDDVALGEHQVPKNFPDTINKNIETNLTSLKLSGLNGLLHQLAVWILSLKRKIKLRFRV